MVEIGNQEMLLSQIIGELKTQEVTLKEQCKKMSVLIEKVANLEADEVAKEEQVLVRNYTLNAGTSYQTKDISNPKYEYVRVFVDVGFVPNQTSGLDVDMIYKNNVYKTGVVQVKASNGSAGAVSEPIDITHLSGFSFQIKNRDTVNDAVVANFRIVLYNKD